MKDVSHNITSTDADLLVSKAVTFLLKNRTEPIKTLLGIPRGGVSVAYAVAREIERRKPDWPTVHVTRTWHGILPHQFDSAVVVDDIVDTGRTLEPFQRVGFETLSLLVRSTSTIKPTVYAQEVDSGWYSFPWDEASKSPEDAVVRILEYLEVDPNDPSLKETPRRFLSWLSEFKENQEGPEITTFDGVVYDQMVLVRDIPFISLCEHHLLPFIGKVAIAYIPTGSVIGLSKLARIAQYHAKRLQVQERMTQQILNDVIEATSTAHAGVIVKAEHTCMSMRGPKADGHSTITSALYGDFRTDPKTREELLNLAGF